MQQAMTRWGMTTAGVSILIRSEDRMQRRDLPDRGLPGRVSILIRSEDRMQRGRSTAVADWWMFQSSSGPRTGCNKYPLYVAIHAGKFQSSSGPRTGCNSMPLPASDPWCTFQSSSGPRTGCNGGFGSSGATEWRFNPHPVRGPDATPRGPWGRFERGSFNPHPVRGPDATPGAVCRSDCTARFQSSSGPRTGCNAAL